MKVTIDEKQCERRGLQPEEVLLSLFLRCGADLAKTIDELLKREVIVFVEGKYYVTQHWSDVIDEILVDSSGAVDDEVRLLNLAEKMRKCFPAGKMPGTPYYYRCNNREVILKMKKFFLQYGNYTDDAIVDATKKFIASFNGNYRYLPLVKYFISKNKTVQDEDGTNHIVETSALATYLENKEDDIEYNEDWLSTSRN